MCGMGLNIQVSCTKIAFPDFQADYLQTTEVYRNIQRSILTNSSNKDSTTFA